MILNRLQGIKCTSIVRRNLTNDGKFKISKIMSSNRGEIAVRVFRAAKESGLKTLAVYSKEDSLQFHRTYSDESYVLDITDLPVAAYLNIDNIIELAIKHKVDAIHPGYGFLSERADFARKCEDAGIHFIGPSSHVIDLMGDKMKARKLAIENNIPVIPGTDKPVENVSEIEKFSSIYGFPIIFKAAYGGGGRGMRIVRQPSEISQSFESAFSEAQKAFGNGSLFVERYIENPRHVEVQILGDKYGNVVHLYDRECSVQRRHQKVVEIAPAKFFISENLRESLLEMAVRLCKAAKYSSAGTVEFLIDQKGNPYFIEVNSRLQVEHTVSEEVTDIDVVKAQLKIAQGLTLEEIGISQSNIKTHGCSIQVRVTTEDSNNNFIPDYGVITEFCPPSGPGIRVDGASGFLGATITPHYDSLLAKVISRGANFEEAISRLNRALDEFKISGVKTNINFLQSLLNHPEFISKNFSTSFISKNYADLKTEKTNLTLELNKILNYVTTVSINGALTPLVTNLQPSSVLPIVPSIGKNKECSGWRDILIKEGKGAFLNKILEQKKVLLTDTTLRDAHQSLLATRMRTYDMKKIAPHLTYNLKDLFSLECWGGATFDVAMRFLYECPWDRLIQLRELIPNIPFQMLLRGANIVGYKNYPDNVVEKFCELSHQSGMDIFRIFDALNYLPNFTVAMNSVQKAGGVVEAAISYSGDVGNPNKKKYTLEYYMELAKNLIENGTDILGIKDMAGVLKPHSAKLLISELRREFPNVPIHLHTHDTAGTGIATYLEAVKAGANIVDVACDSMSGMTSQPSMGGLVAALQGTNIDTGISLDHVGDYSAYFEQTRNMYSPFECCVTMKSGNADVYKNEIPGGQYTNLQFQSYILGLGDQFEKVKKMYIEANMLLGDIIKVTPTSKVVGDLAQFMVQNNLTADDVLKRADELDFPASVIEFMKGDLGQPYQGFPEELRRKIFRKINYKIEDYKVASVEPLDFEDLKMKLVQKFGKNNISDLDVMSAAVYPDVFDEYCNNKINYYGILDKLPTNIFLTGLKQGEEFSFEFIPGKIINVKFLAKSDIVEEVKRDVYLSIDGQLKIIRVVDKEASKTNQGSIKADKNNSKHIGAPMPGSVIKMLVKPGDFVKKGDVLLVLSAMKMETNVSALIDGEVLSVLKEEKKSVQSGDLIIKFK